MRIAFLTQYYPPELGAPQARLSELAAHFTARGHAVDVLTAMPNYPAGKIHPGYGGLLRRETVAGARVLRSFIYPTQRADFLHRLTNYFSFVVSSAVVGTAALPRPDYLLVESPPLFLGYAGVWLSRVKGARMIFNVSDLWPESAVSLGMVRRESRAYSLSARLEAWCYRKAWLVTGQSAEILADVSRRFPAVSTYHLSNGCDTEAFHPGVARPGVFGEGGGAVVLYAGLHGLAQGLDQLLDAAGLLRGGPARFVLVGEGPVKRDLVAGAGTRGLENVEFRDPVPKTEMPALVASADIVVVPLKKYIPGAVPSKLYEAMASARPVVLVAEGEAAEILRRADAGIVVRPGDVEGLAAAVRALAADPALRRRLGENGRRAAVERYDRARIADRFIGLLEQRLAGGAGRDTAPAPEPDGAHA